MSGMAVQSIRLRFGWWCLSLEYIIDGITVGAMLSATTLAGGGVYSMDNPMDFWQNSTPSTLCAIKISDFFSLFFSYLSIIHIVILCIRIEFSNQSILIL